MEIVFLENKYTKWYFNIIRNAAASTRYVEKHHIIPRCIGGTNRRENIVSLTAREHFICHLLLTKMTTGKVKQAMCWAVGKFAQENKNQDRKFTSWEYQKIRENISLARKGTKHSEETRKKMSEKRRGKSPWNKGVTGITHSEESNRKRSSTLTGRIISEEHRAKISASKLGKPSGMLGKQSTRKGKPGTRHSEETKKKLSEMRRGIKFSESHQKNLTEANRVNGAKRRGVKQTQVECPFCHKVGGKNMMTRYHFDNCKLAVV